MACSFPVLLTRDISDPGPHSVVVTATDVFGQTFSIPLGVRRKQIYFSLVFFCVDTDCIIPNLLCFYMIIGVNNVLAAVSHIVLGEPLDGACGVADVIGGSQLRAEIGCSFTNPVASILCSFDGGEQEECSFPLIATSERFGIGGHSVLVTATDRFGQTFSITVGFTIRRKHVYSPLSFMC